MKVVAFSDLHLFAARSRGEQFLFSFLPKIEDADTLIICGDLFDFRWSSDATLDEAVERGYHWLKDFCERVPDTKIIYLLGNHDGIVEFIPHLKKVAMTYDNFQWKEDFTVVGETLFMHGDIPMKSFGDALTPRQLNADEYLRNPLMSVLYSAVTYVGLLKLWRIATNQNRHIPFLAQAVARYAKSSKTPITKVVFGHSHNALSEFVCDGISFHNCGTGIWGFCKNPYEAEVESR